MNEHDEQAVADGDWEEIPDKEGGKSGEASVADSAESCAITGASDDDVANADKKGSPGKSNSTKNNNSFEKVDESTCVLTFEMKEDDLVRVVLHSDNDDLEDRLYRNKKSQQKFGTFSSKMAPLLKEVHEKHQLELQEKDRELRALNLKLKSEMSNRQVLEMTVEAVQEEKRVLSREVANFADIHNRELQEECQVLRERLALITDAFNKEHQRQQEENADLVQKIAMLGGEMFADAQQDVVVVSAAATPTTTEEDDMAVTSENDDNESSDGECPHDEKEDASAASSSANAPTKMMGDATTQRLELEKMRLENRLYEANGEISRLTVSLGTIQSELNKASDEVTKLTRDNAQLTATVHIYQEDGGRHHQEYAEGEQRDSAMLTFASATTGSGSNFATQLLPKVIAEKANLEVKLQEANRELEGVMACLETVQGQLDVAKDRVAELEDVQDGEFKKEEGDDELTTLQKELAYAKKRVSTLQTNNTEMFNELDNYKAVYEEAEAENEELENRLVDANCEIEELRSSLGTVEEKLGDANDRIFSLEAANFSLETDIGNYQEQLEQIQAGADGARENLLSVHALLREAKLEKEKVEEMLAEEHEEVERLMESLSSIQAELYEANSRVSELNARNGALEDETMDHKVKYLQVATELKKLRDRLQMQSKKIEPECDNASHEEEKKEEEDAENHAKESSDSATENTDASDMPSLASNLVHGKDVSVEKAVADMYVELEVEELEKKLEDTTAKYNAIAAKFESVEGELNQAMEKIYFLEESQDALSDQVEQYMQKYEDACATVDDTKAELERVEVALEQAGVEQVEKADLAAKVIEYKEKYEEACTKVEKAEWELKLARDALEYAQQERDDLLASMEEKQKTLKEKAREYKTKYDDACMTTDKTKVEIHNKLSAQVSWFKDKYEEANKRAEKGQADLRLAKQAIRKMQREMGLLTTTSEEKASCSVSAESQNTTGSSSGPTNGSKDKKKSWRKKSPSKPGKSSTVNRRIRDLGFI